MFCTVSAAWTRLILLLYCTKPGSSCGAVLSGRITIVAMSRSGQLSLRCTVTRDRALDTCEPNCVPEAARPFFIPVVHSPLGSWDTWQHRSSPLGEAEPGAMGHVAALEPTSIGR
jgi:hypothetical protein